MGGCAIKGAGLLAGIGKGACLITGIGALLAGCALQPDGTAHCTTALGSPVLVFDLFFGRAIPARGSLTEAEWRDFQREVVTPNLPNGYTTLDANGAWMNPTTHKTGEEATKVLLVALPDTPGSLAAINRIRTAYQMQFHQQLVGMSVQAGCASF